MLEIICYKLPAVLFEKAFILESFKQTWLEANLEHLTIIDYKAARHFITKLHVIYLIMGLKHANNECCINIMFPCFIYFH